MLFSKSAVVLVTAVLCAVFCAVSANVEGHSSKLCTFDERVHASYTKWDVNGDRNLSLDEVELVLRSWGFDLDIEHVDQVRLTLSSADGNQDGRVTPEEFHAHAHAIAGLEEKEKMERCTALRGPLLHEEGGRRLEEKEAKNTKVVKADPTSKSSNLKGGSKGKKPSDFGLHYDAVQVRKPGSFAGRQATLFSSKEVKEMMKAFINAKVKPVMQNLGAEITSGLMTEIMCKGDGGADRCDQNTKNLIDTIGGHIGALFSYIPGLLLKMTESFIPTFRMVQSLQGQAATGVSGAGGKASASGDLAAFAFICPGPNAKVNKFLDEKLKFGLAPSMVAVHFAANGEFKGDFTIVNPAKIDPSKTQKLGAVDLSLQTMGVASAYDSVFEFNDINGDGEYTVGTDTKGREIRLGQIGWKEISDTIVTTGSATGCDAGSNVIGCSLPDGVALQFNTTTVPITDTTVDPTGAFKVTAEFEYATTPMGDPYGAILTPNSLKLGLKIENFPYSLTGANVMLAAKAGMAQAGGNVTANALLEGKVGNVIKFASKAATDIGAIRWKDVASVETNSGSTKVISDGKVKAAEAVTGISGDLGPIGFLGQVALGGNAKAGIEYFTFTGNKPSMVFWDPEVIDGDPEDSVPPAQFVAKYGSYMLAGVAGLGVILIAVGLLMSGSKNKESYGDRM